LKKTSLGPLRQGQRLDTSETKQSSSKERKPPKKSSKNYKELPYTHASSPWTNAPPPGRMHANQLKIGQLQQLQHSHWSDRWPLPVRPVHNKAQKWLETTWNPSKCVQQAISSSNFSPLLAMHESSQKCKTLNLELLK
jgi:hypothetical protein